jgi:hypothetical protein
MVVVIGLLGGCSSNQPPSQPPVGRETSDEPKAHTRNEAQCRLAQEYARRLADLRSQSIGKPEDYADTSEYMRAFSEHNEQVRLAQAQMDAAAAACRG